MTSQTQGWMLYHTTASEKLKVVHLSLRNYKWRLHKWQQLRTKTNPTRNILMKKCAKRRRMVHERRLADDNFLQRSYSLRNHRWIMNRVCANMAQAFALVWLTIRGHCLRQLSRDYQQTSLETSLDIARLPLTYRRRWLARIICGWRYIRSTHTH